MLMFIFFVFASAYAMYRGVLWDENRKKMLVQAQREANGHGVHAILEQWNREIMQYEQTNKCCMGQTNA